VRPRRGWPGAGFVDASPWAGIIFRTLLCIVLPAARLLARLPYLFGLPARQPADVFLSCLCMNRSHPRRANVSRQRPSPRRRNVPVAFRHDGLLVACVEGGAQPSRVGPSVLARNSQLRHPIFADTCGKLSLNSGPGGRAVSRGAALPDRNGHRRGRTLAIRVASGGGNGDQSLAKTLRIIFGGHGGSDAPLSPRKKPCFARAKLTLPLVFFVFPCFWAC